MPPKAAGPIVTLKYGGYSDADSTHRPSGAQWQKCDLDWVKKVYQSKVAQKWMEDTGQAEDGKQYQLDRLPPGYEVWEKARNEREGSKHYVDRFCFGHPSHGQGFNSPYDFYPHFEFLMRYEGEEDVCKCRFCSKTGNSARKATPRSSSKPAASKPKALGIRGRPPLKRGPVDDEGSPDIIKRLLSVLQQEGHIDRKVEERSNMDWRVETVVYQGARQLTTSQHSFVPRIGELVLFHRGVDGEVRTDPDSGELKIWNTASQSFTGHPKWLGGIVTQVPIPAEPVRLKDITHETPKKHNVNSSGFRVECYPSPNDKNKSFSKQYSHVPLHQIRPMMSCDDTLQGIATEDWHPTIQNVMTAMGTVSCVSRYKIKGIWPNSGMFCEAIYLGSEVIWAGEPLRLMPRGKETAVIDVIVPECFVVRVYGLQPEEDGTITGNRAKKIHLLVIGSVYTTDKNSESCPVEDDDEIPKTMHAYGPWYHKSTSQAKYETGFTHILGRLYEFEAMKQWFPNITAPEALDKGMASTRTSRAYATSHRKDHSGAHLGWFWGEDRASALDLATFNGIEVGEYDKEREPNKWREVLAVLDGLKDRVVEPVAESSSHGDEGASGGFIAVNHRKSSLVAPPITKEESDAEGETPGRTGNKVIDVDEYDDVIEGLISGEGFSTIADPHEEGSSSAAPAAKRARVV